MRPELVIFDCDGVLVDSEPVACRVLAEALSDFGWRLHPEEADHLFRGRSLPDIIALVEHELARPVPDGFVQSLNESTRRAFDMSLEPIDGVRDVLEAISLAGIDTCVASSGSPEKIRHSLKLTGLSRFFEDRIFSAFQVERGKPAPDLFRFAADQMGHQIETSVVIEDSLPGVTGAVAAGSIVFGFASNLLRDDGKHARNLAQAGAIVFGSMTELPRLLELPGSG